MQDADQVVVGANSSVAVAPVGTVLPTTFAALNAAFVDLGFTNEDGFGFADSKEIEDILAAQAFYPIRSVVASKESTLEFVLRQWNSDTVAFAFGGGSVNEVSGISTYYPPEPGEIDYRSMVLEWEDGAKTYRLVVPRGMVTGEVSFSVNRTSAADLPIAFSVRPSGAPDPLDEDTQPWYLLIDDNDFHALT